MKLVLMALGAGAFWWLYQFGNKKKDKRIQAAAWVVGVALLVYSSWDMVVMLQNRPHPVVQEPGPPPAPTATSAVTPAPSPAPAPVVSAVPSPAPPPVAAPPTATSAVKSWGRDPFFATAPLPSSTAGGAGVGAPPPKDATLSLTGVCTSGKQAAYAIINNMVVKVGEQLPGGEGYELRAVRENGVLLFKDGKEYYLPIK